MTDISVTLNERGADYGRFADQAVIAQSLKGIMRAARNWGNLADDQCEALDMIANKIARLLNGNPDHYDGWHDIAGYAELIAQRLAPE